MVLTGERSGQGGFLEKGTSLMRWEGGERWPWNPEG